MKKLLKSILRLILGAGCLALLCIGVLEAVILGFLGIVVFFGAVNEGMIDLAGFALFGVLTVALASLCCGGGLLFLLGFCCGRPSALSRTDKTLACLSLAAVLVTVGLFWSTQGQYFGPVCITADILYVLIILLYFRIKRGASHDPDRS